MAVFDSTRKSSIGELENDPKRVPHPHTIKRLSDALELSGDERLVLAAAAEQRRSLVSANRRAALQPVAELTEGPDKVDRPGAAVEAAESREVVEAVESADAPLPPPGPSGVGGRRAVRHWKVWAVVVTVVAVLVVAAIAAMRSGTGEGSTAGEVAITPTTPTNSSTSLGSSTSSRTGPAAGLAATIGSPLEGEVVDSPPILQGTAHLPDDRVLWLIVHPSLTPSTTRPPINPSR
jgi:hypothetical protein